MTPDRAPFRYYGSKWRIALWIISHFPPHATYVEPYAGSLAVLLNKPVAPIEVANDIDNAVFTFFRVLRDTPADLLRAIALTPYSRSEFALAAQPCDDPLEQARRFYVRAFGSFGGHQRGQNSTWRYQRDSSKRSCIVREFRNTDHLIQSAARLLNCFLECDDALTILRRYDTPRTLFYCDPPYLANTRSARWHGRGYVCEMTDDDHRALVEHLRTLTSMVIVSHYPCPEYDTLLADGWTAADHTARCTRGMPRLERIYLNPAAAAAAPARQTDLFHSMDTP